MALAVTINASFPSFYPSELHQTWLFEKIIKIVIGDQAQNLTQAECALCP
jgi:hypothetical protein